MPNKPISDRQKVKEIAEIADKICNEWEINFIENMKTWRGSYTSGQRETIDKLYKRACDSPY